MTERILVPQKRGMGGVTRVKRSAFRIPHRNGLWRWAWNGFRQELTKHSQHPDPKNSVPGGLAKIDAPDEILELRRYVSKSSGFVR